MPRATSTDIDSYKLARFKSIKKTIQTLEKQQKQVLKQGKLAPQRVLGWHVIKYAKITKNIGTINYKQQNLVFNVKTNLN